MKIEVENAKKSLIKKETTMTKIEAKKLSAGELVCDFFFLAIPFELSREFLV